LGEIEPLHREARRIAPFLLLALASASATSRAADALDRIRERGTLRWGSDAEGGAPYQFHDPADPSRVIGFEVEIAQALAAALGVRDERAQNNWGELIPGLQRGDYDVAISGLEIVDYRLEAVDFSRPYYATGETLMVRRDEAGIDSLRACRGRVAGTLRETYAHRLLQAEPGVEVRPYDEQVTPYLDLELGRIDAVLLDEMIALYHGVPRKGLRVVGEPIGEVRYGIALPKGEERLRAAIDEALGALIRDGTLRSIYERWNLWNAKTAALFGDFAVREAPAPAYEAFLRAMAPSASRSWLHYLEVLGLGALVTVQLTLLGMALAVVLGLFLALARLYAPRPLPALAIGYIEVVRGTPLLVQLFLLYYGLGQAGVKLPAFVAGFLGLGLNYAASVAEHYRGGLQAIPRGQWDASAMLGLTRLQALRHVVVPQAVRIVIPSVTNDFIAMFKDSSLVSVIALVELTKAYQQLAPVANDYLGIGLVAAAIYLGIGVVVAAASKRLERWLRVEDRAAGAPA
jgi:polar amino acid transport system substrate-binding protein